MNEYELDIEFGDWIRRIREKKGLSLYEAARRAGIQQDRLREIETGHSTKGITRPESSALAICYGVDPKMMELKAAGIDS